MENEEEKREQDPREEHAGENAAQQSSQLPPVAGDPEAPEQPQLSEELDTEHRWAERLGMDYDPATAMKHDEEEKIYVMPASEPLPPPAQPAEPMPPTYMLWAILSTICCCLPAGVVAIIFSAQVSSRYFARDYEGAKRLSRNAEIWIIASIVLGVIFNSIYMPLSLLSMPAI